MKATKTAAALLLSVLIIIISVSPGLTQSANPPGSATVEGTWLVTYEPPGLKDHILGKRFTIRLKGPGEYEVISYTGKALTYFGSSTEIKYIERMTLDNAKRHFRETPDSAIREALGAGLLNTTFSFTLSPDGCTIKQNQTTIILRHYVQSGHLESYQVLPPQESAAIICNSQDLI